MKSMEVVLGRQKAQTLKKNLALMGVFILAITLHYIKTFIPGPWYSGEIVYYVGVYFVGTLFVKAAYMPPVKDDLKPEVVTQQEDLLNLINQLHRETEKEQKGEK